MSLESRLHLQNHCPTATIEPSCRVTNSTDHSHTQEQSSGKRLYAVPHDAKPTALVVYCSDPRFQVAFEDFLGHELGLAKGTYIPTVVGGGAGVLGHPEQLPKEFKFLKERFETYREVFPTARRLILINHEDCRYYEALKGKVLAALGLRTGFAEHYARTDLSLVSRAFKHMLSHLGYSVEYYYARFANPEHTKIEIEKVFA
jgi:hypothetical protein